MMATPRLRVMQSFGAPRPTSNPYVHMLDSALRSERGIEHLRFDRRRALVGRYEVLHFHWPETLLGGASAPKRLARRVYTTLLAARLAVTPVAVVRTVHNLELPDVDSRWEAWLLRVLDRRADLHIALNKDTPTRPGTPAHLIPHGHYVDWFANAPKSDPAEKTLGFLGLIRRYKGVEQLIDSFTATAAELPDWSLRIAGNPTSESMRAEVRERAGGDARISLDLRYLSEDDFAHAATSVTGVVLPYRAMHNSGAALAALSLGRPVLVPRNRVNEDLAREVGEGWVNMFDGDLTAADLIAFARAAAALPAFPPDLADRGWALVGRRHRDAYVDAVQARRGPR